MMANQVQNPFEDEKPQLVHFEKSESHYEYCRMQMHEIERAHRRTFMVHLALCVVVCFLSIFQKYIGGFDLLSRPYLEIDHPGAILAGGIFQIVIAMILIVLGYLAWANFHSLNIILEAWYAIVTVVGIFRLDYLTALVGIVGAVFYFFSIREMGREQTLSEMEGYPDFQETFDITKSDIVIQTLLAHQGERRTKSTLFTTDYSLRRMKKKKPSNFGTGLPADSAESSAGAALAEALQKGLDDVKDARQARTAIASLDAVTADIERTKDAKKKKQQQDAAAEPAEAAAPSDDAMSDILTEAAPQPEPASEPETESAPEEKAEPQSAQNDTQKKPAQNQPNNQNHPNQNRQNPNHQNRKKKKKKK